MAGRQSYDHSNERQIRALARMLEEQGPEHVVRMLTEAAKRVPSARSLAVKIERGGVLPGMGLAGPGPMTLSPVVRQALEERALIRLGEDQATNISRRLDAMFEERPITMYQKEQARPKKYGPVKKVPVAGRSSGR
jgi:hypothetical protein